MAIAGYDISLNAGLPEEYRLALAAAQQKYELARNLQAQTQKGVQIQQIGPVAAKISPWAIAANTLAGGLASASMANAQTEMAGASSRAEAAQLKGVQEYLSQPPRVRINSGLASPNPMVQALAKKEAESAQKQFESVLGNVGRQNPNVAIGMARSNELPTEVVPLPGKEVNGQLVDGITGEVRKDLRTQFKPEEIIKGPGGAILVQREDRIGGKVDAIDKAPKVTATASSSSAPAKAESAFGAGMADLNVKEFGAARAAAQSAQGTLAMVKQMEDLDKKGVFSGPGSPPVMFLAGLGKQLGLPVDSAKLANSEAFQRQFAQKIASVMLDGSVGRSMTDPDRKRFEETLPGLLQGPEARQQIYAQLRAEANARIARHRSFAEQLNAQYPEARLPLGLNPVEQNPGLGTAPYVPGVAPGTPSNNGLGSPARPMTPAEYEAYRKARGG